MTTHASADDQAYLRELIAKRKQWLAKRDSFRARGMPVEARAMSEMSGDVTKKISAWRRYESGTKKLARKQIAKLKKHL